jgi:hypothetical protein
VALAQEQVADWRLEYARVEKLRDAAAERFAEVPQLIDKLVELLQLAETVDKECSRLNQSAPPGYHHLDGPELHARNLTSFSRSNPPIFKNIFCPTL